jgi:hypothetical protein
MIKAERLVLPAARPGNEPPLGSLSLNQAAAALVALVNGAEQIPTIADLRCLVRRGLRARRNAAKGGRRYAV